MQQLKAQKTNKVTPTTPMFYLTYAKDQVAMTTFMTANC